jgi:hypothetical protein
MTELNMFDLAQYTTQEIRLAFERNKQLIADKNPNTRASAKFWKAVENRQKLHRELTVRGEAPETVKIPLPADRKPLLTFESGE